MVAQVPAPAAYTSLTNWLVQSIPAYSAKDPSAPAKTKAEVILETAKLVVVALVVVPKLTVRLVMVEEAALIITAIGVVEGVITNVETNDQLEIAVPVESVPQTKK